MFWDVEQSSYANNDLNLHQMNKIFINNIFPWWASGQLM